MELTEEELGTGSYYTVLGVSSQSSIDEIKRAYRKMAMVKFWFLGSFSLFRLVFGNAVLPMVNCWWVILQQWHPDRWTKTPSLLSEAKRKFQQIQEAYSVLSDKRKRTLYDAGLYDSEDEQDEEFCDFLQDLMALMAQDRKEVREKNYSIEELQAMLIEMAQGFNQSPQWFLGDFRHPKRMRCDSNPMAWGAWGASGYCN
ncbi:hypothetical protein K2173_002184 [Erythroxylum novogranatense]|uniref:J domain-containing protein n=1 Tax=Erythroxylum novogranatense TaxID=1862640 RepID=A0AAV8TRC3_9ROSI|nr:hypothetical protein K2173_002184 [Erythroxylum novogranatense]